MFALLTLSPFELGLRIAMACVFGFLLGYDRKQKNKPIGYQSYMIIVLITCLIAVMGQELYVKYQHADDVVIVDLAKIIAGALTGIGFLGAGAIIKRDDKHLVGTATGASIWAAGGLGMMLGFGFYSLSISGFVVIWAILTLLPKMKL